MEKQERGKWITGTGIGLIILLIGGYLLFAMFIDTNGSSAGDFSYYAGPVLPMTSLNGAEGLAVSRKVDFDFSPYAEEKNYSNLGKSGARITDAYKLTNITGETVETTLVYGFQGQFIDYAEEFPTITVDGETVQPELRPSVDPGSTIWRAWNFENYSQIQAEGDFLSVALAEPELAEVPVTVYHFTDLAYTGREVAGFPMLVVTFDLDENTSMWVDKTASIGTVEDSDRHRLMFPVDWGEGWILTMGGTPTNMEFGGNRDYNINEKSAIDGVEYKLEVYEADLLSVLEQLAGNYDFWELESGYPNPGMVTPEILLDGALKQIDQLDWLESENRVRYISDLFHNAVTDHRMMYLVFPVTVPAGQTVRVEAGYIQEPSYDISGPKEKREGYDLATKLGSNLNFTELSASISNIARIKIGEQNFGFDPENGITAVNLDLAIARYFLEIRVSEK